MELVGQGLLHCVGVYDGISLAVAEQVGAQALYLSGMAISASLLGLPDSGLITQTEMHQTIARLCSQTALPVIADADTGYGDLGNVARTMRLWEAAGVAGLHIEDQV
ncbi:isocitrate lyase/PEP mutase family protein, partial [Nostoc sp. NIES-2111]